MFLRVKFFFILIHFNTIQFFFFSIDQSGINLEIIDTEPNHDATYDERK